MKNCQNCGRALSRPCDMDGVDPVSGMPRPAGQCYECAAADYESACVAAGSTPEEAREARDDAYAGMDDESAPSPVAP